MTNSMRQYERQRDDVCTRESTNIPCDSCGYIFKVDDVVYRSTGIILCSSCNENTFVCVVCGGTIHLNNASHEDEDTCRDCFKDME